MADVFISYNREDQNRARAIAGALGSGARTGDIADGGNAMGTTEMTDAIIAELVKLG